jgi:hypothetical protein
MLLAGAEGMPGEGDVLPTDGVGVGVPAVGRTGMGAAALEVSGADEWVGVGEG